MPRTVPPDLPAVPGKTGCALAKPADFRRFARTCGTRPPDAVVTFA
ncbi:hypothetical protein [Amycolatopsis jejuensis]|nr:hypothetical protein [Amycolatopsis jejuensis]